MRSERLLTDRTRALREVVAFTALTLGLTAATTSVAAAEGLDLRRLEAASPAAQAALYATGFVPLLVAAGVSLASRGTLRGLGWGLGATRRYLLPSWGLPIACCAVAYGTAWGTGLAGLSTAGLAADVGAPGVPDGVVAAAAVALALTAGLLPYGLVALGEEIGWRGLLVPRLAELTSLPRAALLSGVAWTVAHLPLLVLVPGGADGVPLAVALPAFAGCAVALSFPLAWLRMRSGSVWPAVLLHASWNAAIFLAFDPLTVPEAGRAWATGEKGVLLAVVTPLACVAWLRRAGARTPVQMGRRSPCDDSGSATTSRRACGSSRCSSCSAGWSSPWSRRRSTTAG